MREEVLNWWKQAQSDIDSAQAVFDIGRFYVAAFLSQQAVEKARGGVKSSTALTQF